MSRTGLRLLATAFAVVCLPCFASAQLTFNTTTYPTGAAYGVTSADLNRDGLPDLAVGVGNTVQVFLATGPGAYGPHTDYPLPNSGAVTHIVAADFTGDGNVDLLAGDPLVLLLNNGDGTFQVTSGPQNFGPIQGIAAGDFNHDGSIDFATIEGGPGGTGSSAHVYLNQGNGTFTRSPAIGSTDTPLAGLVAADFNRDGHVDLATEGIAPTRGLVYFGHGDGTFVEHIVAISNPVPANAMAAVGTPATGDLDNDGVPDLVLLEGWSCGLACGEMHARSYISAGDGTFFERIPFVTTSTTGSGGSVIVSDLEGDLRQDLIYWNPSHFGGEVRMFHGEANGTFGPELTGSPTSGDVFEIIARDLNLDSRHDVVFTSWLGGSMGVAISSTGAANCTPPASDTIRAKFCAPDPGDFASGVTFGGSGNSPAGIQRLELWIDGVKRYETVNDQLLRSETLSPGQHLVELVAVDKYAGVGKTSMVLNTGSGGECTAAPETVTFCGPVPGISVSSPVQFSFAANFAGLAYMRLYVDDQPVWESAATSPAEFHPVIALSAGPHRAVLVAYTSSGDHTAGTTFSVIGGGGGGGGSCTAATNTAHLCAPANGSTVTSPVTFTGTANAATIYGLRLYVDDQVVFDTQSSSFSFATFVGVGSHHAVLVAYTSAGDLTSQSFFTVSGQSGGDNGPCTAATGLVSLCLPQNNSTVTSPVRFNGAGAMQNEVLLRLYVDDQPVFETSASSFDIMLNVGPGNHRAVLVGYSSNGAVDDQTSQRFFTVSP